MHRRIEPFKRSKQKTNVDGRWMIDNTMYNGEREGTSVSAEGYLDF